MYADPFVLVLILLVGCAAFLFGVFYLAFWVLGGVGKGVLKVLRPRSVTPRRRRPRSRRGARVCSDDECRKIEYREARYCSQCGAPLGRQVVNSEV